MTARVCSTLLATLLATSGAGAQTQPSGRASQTPQRTAIPLQPGLAAVNCPVAAAAAIADVPDTADLIIVVEHASELRASPMGDAVSQFLTDAAMVNLTKAWSRLADQLGLTHDEAFNRLLGQRVVLVSRATANGNDRLWAILSDITVDTDQKLRDKLQAAPRAIDQGHNILTIENGQYQLTSHMRGSKAGPGAAKSSKANHPAPTDRVSLLLGPTDKPELFDELLAVVSREGNPNAPAPAPAISTHDVFAQACQAGPTEVLILAALDDAPAAPGAPAVGRAERWKNFVVLAARRDNDGPINDPENRRGATWRSRVVVRQTERRDDLLKIDPSSDAPFRALADGALIAMMQNTPLPDVLGGWAPPGLGNILSLVPIPEDAKQQMSARQALCVRALPPNDRVSCTVARGAPSTAQLARTLDPQVSAGVQRIEKQFGVEAPPPQDYAGLAPNAVRTTELACSQKGLSVFSSRPLTVSWAYPSQVAVNGPANLDDRAVKVAGCAAQGPPPDRPGWWVMNIAQTVNPVPGAGNPPNPPNNPAKPPPSPAELLRSDANALLTTDPAGQTARWVWLAAAHPAALEAVLPSAFPDYNGIRSGLRRIEYVDLKLQITEQGDIQGDLALRLAPAPPK